MGGWKKKAAPSNQQREYSHCTRCHVAKHGNDRKFHWCEPCYFAYEQIKDDKQKRIDFCLEGQRITECVFSSDSDED